MEIMYVRDKDAGRDPARARSFTSVLPFQRVLVAYSVTVPELGGRTIYIGSFIWYLLVGGFNIFQTLMPRKKINNWKLYFAKDWNEELCHLRTYVNHWGIPSTCIENWFIFFCSKMRKKLKKHSLASLLICHNILIHHKTINI